MVVLTTKFVCLKIKSNECYELSNSGKTLGEIIYKIKDECMKQALLCLVNCNPATRSKLLYKLIYITRVLQLTDALSSSDA